MIKEFIVKSIDTLPQDRTNVIVFLIPLKEVQEGSSPSHQLDSSKTMNPNNMEDMIKDFNKMFSKMGGRFGATTSLKIEMHEYKKMGLSVGDKVSVELTKENNHDSY